MIYVNVIWVDEIVVDTINMIFPIKYMRANFLFKTDAETVVFEPAVHIEYMRAEHGATWAAVKDPGIGESCP